MPDDLNTTIRVRAWTLFLAVVGVCGLISYYTSQRTHEIGVRMSLGAQCGDVMRLVLSEGMLLTGVGIVIGIAAGYGFAKSLARLIYGISATDFPSFAPDARCLPTQWSHSDASNFSRSVLPS